VNHYSSTDCNSAGRYRLSIFYIIVVSTIQMLISLCILFESGCPFLYTQPIWSTDSDWSIPRSTFLACSTNRVEWQESVHISKAKYCDEICLKDQILYDGILTFPLVHNDLPTGSLVMGKGDQLCTNSMLHRHGSNLHLRISFMKEMKLTIKE
jgi:hypothetical protein